MNLCSLLAHPKQIFECHTALKASPLTHALTIRASQVPLSPTTNLLKYIVRSCRRTTLPHKWKNGVYNPNKQIHNPKYQLCKTKNQRHQLKNRTYNTKNQTRLPLPQRPLLQLHRALSRFAHHITPTILKTTVLIFHHRHPLMLRFLRELSLPPPDAAYTLRNHVVLVCLQTCRLGLVLVLGFPCDHYPP